MSTTEPAPITRSTPRWVYAALVLLVAVYLVYSSFGVDGPFLWGHHGYHGATYMLRAKMSLRFHMVTPANWSGYEAPPKSAYYLHHPIGYHHILTLLVPIFGDGEWLPRAVAALGGVPLLILLFRLVRRRWSPEAAVLAVAVYVGLPIVCSFSVLSDPMLLAMTMSIWSVDLYLHYLDRPSSRLLWLGCLSYVLGGLLMWEAYFQAFFHGVHALIWSYTAAGRGATVGSGRFARCSAGRTWFFLTGTAAALTMTFHAVYTIAIGMAQDFASSFSYRHNTSFDHAWTQHWRWLDLLYGKPLIGLGFLWLGLFLVRAALHRTRRRDQAVLIFFLINLLYILLFAQASAVHLYRVFWFSTFLALAVTDLISDLHAAALHLLARLGSARLLAAATALAATAAYFIVETPHAYANLLESRVMMGTHGQAGYDPQYTKMMFGRQVNRRTTPADYVISHANLGGRTEFYYHLDRSGIAVSNLSQLPVLLRDHPKAVVITDSRVSGPERQLLLQQMKSHPVYLFNEFLMLDLRSDVPGVHQYRFTPEQPSWAWRWFVSHKYPPLRLVEVPASFK